MYQFQTVAVQVQIIDHLGMQQTDRIGGHGIAEAGVELLRHRCPADHAAAFHHLDRQPGAGKVGGADEAVVTSPNDHHVIFHFRPILVHRGSVGL